MEDSSRREMDGEEFICGMISMTKNSPPKQKKLFRKSILIVKSS